MYHRHHGYGNNDSETNQIESNKIQTLMKKNDFLIHAKARKPERKKWACKLPERALIRLKQVLKKEVLPS